MLSLLFGADLIVTSIDDQGVTLDDEVSIFYDYCKARGDTSFRKHVCSILWTSAFSHNVFTSSSAIYSGDATVPAEVLSIKEDRRAGRADVLSLGVVNLWVTSRWYAGHAGSETEN